MDFYKRLGYRIIRSDVAGTGATIVEKAGPVWRILPVEKYVMRRPVAQAERLLASLGRELYI